MFSNDYLSGIKPALRSIVMSRKDEPAVQSPLVGYSRVLKEKVLSKYRPN